MQTQITLKIKYRIDKYYEVTISNLATVLQLKQMLAESTRSNLPVEQQKLVSQEKLLEDHEILRDLNMQNGTVVYIVKARPPGEPEDTGMFSQMGGAGGLMEQLGQMGGGMGGGGQQQQQQQQQGGGGMQQFYSQILSNPSMQQMMQKMMSNPQMMQQLMTNNPMFQGGGGDFSSLLNNPEQMKAVGSMMQQPGMQQMMGNMMGGAGDGQSENIFNEIGTNFQGMNINQQRTMTAADMNQDQPPEIKYENQLKQMEDIGFNDKQANIQALIKTYGNVQRAIDSLLN